MLDAHELARRLRAAMDKREPKLTSAALGTACRVTPQAVNGWRKNGRIAKKHLAVIAAETGKPLEYFLEATPGAVTANYGLVLTFEEAEAMKRLQNALPDWRLYVLGLATIDDKATQTILLKTMRNAVPDGRVEKFISVAPHAAARAREGVKK
jgi:hypothetical protein